MIRVRKSADIPLSLLAENCNRYDGQDVQKTLVEDQHGKCYICEQRTGKAFEVEHNKAKAIVPALSYKWSNLFLACKYCNGRKPNSLDLLDPAKNNIEDLIIHRLDLSTNTASFINGTVDLQEADTASLLDKLFNGKNKLRDIKGEILYKDLERELITFLGFLNGYKTSLTPKSKQKVIDSLLITKEFLAFKYWIVKDYGFYEVFKDHMLWNKMSNTL